MLYTMSLNEFDKVFDIMSEAFPYDERRTYDEQKQVCFNNPLFTTYVHKDSENGDVKGFISTYDFADFCYVEHFAIALSERGKGLGSEVVDALLALRKRVCLEVEPPVTEQAVRRIKFYEKHGFTLNNFEYIQPPISRGRNPIPLMIMTSFGLLDYDVFSNIKKTLYRNVYHVNENAY